MTSVPLPSWWTRFVAGDPAATARATTACESALRGAVRRCLGGGLRAKFDSDDVVQSVWRRVWPGLRDGRWQFASPAHLRAFLVRSARNAVVDRSRRHRDSVDGRADVELDRLPAHPHPSSHAAHELWQRMLAACPPQHRTILELKRQGFGLTEIAARTELHPSSVRRVLYDVARRVCSRESS